MNLLNLRPLGLAALCLLLLLPGCGFKDIDRRFFVVSIGLDVPENKQMRYKVMIKLAIPNALEEFGANDSLIVQEESKSITEAVRIMKSKVDKELDFGHTKAIIFGEKLLQKEPGIQDMLDWFLRRRDIQQIAWMGIGRPSAYDVLKQQPKTERLPSNQIFLIFGQTGTETAYVTSEYLFDFGRRVHERGLDPIMPVIQARENGQISVNRVALFNKQKIVLELNPEETKIFNSFYENVGKIDFAVQDAGRKAVLSIDTLKSSYKAQPGSGGKPELSVKVTLAGIVEEVQGMDGTSSLARYEKLAEEEAAQRVKHLILKLQKAGVDPIGFGLNYRAHRYVDHAGWDRWLEQYPEAPLKVTVDVRLRGTGTIE
ncbi:Ger(x)C family spore germination protein [Gorillibacterium sp. sgz5001074]|uniref:Ger(x)C family spore germination protein n=1 Tax=Gorillibacterium sp. sgz5001074 TaxID=3446695 RepID=UPI003F6773B7